METETRSHASATATAPVNVNASAAQFLTQCCEYVEGATTPAADLQRDFRLYCQLEGLEPSSASRLGHAVATMMSGVVRDHEYAAGQRQRIYRNLRIESI